MNREYITPEKPEPRVQVQPKQISEQFSLQRLRARIYDGKIPNGTTVGEDADFDSNGQSFTSYLGTPVFSNLDFIGGSYKNLQGEQIEYEDLRIDTVLFDVSQQKNVVTTEIQGRNGTIKEYISDGDFAINISGLIVQPDANLSLIHISEPTRPY